MVRDIVLFFSLMLFAIPSIGASRSEPAVSDVPFSLQKGLVIVEAKIKKDVSVQVLLATGTEYSMIDPALLQKYELKASYAADGPVTGRNDTTYTFSAVSSVRVGDSKSRDLNMRFGSMAAVSRMVGQEIFGTLGADFFEGQTVQFDFKNRVIRFLDKIPTDLIDSKNPGGATVLRMAPKPSNPFQPTFLVPLVRDVQVNGQKTNLLINTGIATSVAFSSATAKKVNLPIAIDSGGREEKITLRFESLEMTDVPAWVYAKGTSADQSLSKYGAVAGSLFLQQFVATFDYRKGVVVLERI